MRYEIYNNFEQKVIRLLLIVFHLFFFSLSQSKCIFMLNILLMVSNLIINALLNKYKHMWHEIGFWILEIHFFAIIIL